MNKREQGEGGLRLQVFLSRNGYCSRRKAMDLIQQGCVSVNGKKVEEPSFSVTLEDRISVSGQMIARKDFEYILLNKPAGYVTTKKDRFAQQTVLDLLPKQYQHLNPVGRLDKNTEGLLLLTNDGQMAQRLQHPSFEVYKTYEVCIDGILTPKEKLQLEKGVRIEERKTSPVTVTGLKVKKGFSEFLLTMHEGRKRQIRKMVKFIGHQVLALCRIRQGPIALGDLPRGKFRRLTVKEIQALHRGKT